MKLISHYLLCKNGRKVLSEKLSHYVLRIMQTPHILITEFESRALRVGKFCILVLWSKLLGVFSHTCAVISPLCHTHRNVAETKVIRCRGHIHPKSCDLTRKSITP